MIEHADMPPPPSDLLAEFAARAERSTDLPTLRISIQVYDTADGHRFEYDTIGYASSIREIAVLVHRLRGQDGEA